MIPLAQFDKAIRAVTTGTEDDFPLETMLSDIPRVDELVDEPRNATVLIRADLDEPVSQGVVTDRSRLQSCLPTIRYCLGRGWKVVLIGHIGRKGESLRPVADALSEELGRPVSFIPNWVNEDTSRLLDEAVATIADAPANAILMLENARRNTIEQALWNAPETGSTGLAEPMSILAQDIATRISDVYINEAVAASNPDFSSTILPLGARTCALGFYIKGELESVLDAARADAIFMSGLKANKLDDLQNMIQHGCIELVVVAGSLAMALKKAVSRLDGSDFCIGRAETDISAPFYISEERMEQASQIMSYCRARNIDVLLPTDFILDDESTSESIPRDAAQLDIGPETQSRITEALQAYGSRKEGKGILFYNGVPGKFEEARFSAGTRSIIAAVSDLHRHGIKVYVGGGEGRQALLKYSAADKVTHVFTAGGTVLKALARTPLPPIVALYLNRQGISHG